MMKLGGSGAKVTLKDNDDEHQVTIPELIGDFSLNVANALTAWELLQYGCSRVTASYDLNAHAITKLLETAGEANAPNVEIVAHTHIPIFHTEHCVFARFLSNGNSYVDCGHVCTRHNIHLRDQTGADNLVLADMGCRNTVFSAQAQSGAHSLKEWMAVGANRFRIELVDESPEDVELIVDGYLDVLDGAMRPNELWEVLEHVCDSNGRKGGVSFGSLRNTAERRAGEIL
jgi:collagenase-like PrtC family protease